MCEIIDFQSRRTDALRRKAERYAEDLGHHAARAEWLKRNGAPLVDQVRATLDAERASRDCLDIEQILSGLSGAANGNLPN